MAHYMEFSSTGIDRNILGFIALDSKNGKWVYEDSFLRAGPAYTIPPLMRSQQHSIILLP